MSLIAADNTLTPPDPEAADPTPRRGRHRAPTPRRVLALRAAVLVALCLAVCATAVFGWF